MTQKLSDQALKNKRAYTKEYAKKNLKRVPLDMPISDYETLRAAAEDAGEPVNTYIKKAIVMRIASEGSVTF